MNCDAKKLRCTNFTLKTKTNTSLGPVSKLKRYQIIYITFFEKLSFLRIANEDIEMRQMIKGCPLYFCYPFVPLLKKPQKLNLFKSVSAEVFPEIDNFRAFCYF